MGRLVAKGSLAVECRRSRSRRHTWSCKQCQPALTTLVAGHPGETAIRRALSPIPVWLRRRVMFEDSSSNEVPPMPSGGSLRQSQDMADWFQPEARDLRAPPSLDPHLESFLGEKKCRPKPMRGMVPRGKSPNSPLLRTPVPGWHGEPNRSICPLGGQNWRQSPIKEMSMNLWGECRHHSRCIWNAITLARGSTTILHPQLPVVLTVTPTSHGWTWSSAVCTTEYANHKRPWLMPEHYSMGRTSQPSNTWPTPSAYGIHDRIEEQYGTFYLFHGCWGIWWSRMSTLGVVDSIQGSTTTGTQGHTAEELRPKWRAHTQGSFYWPAAEDASRVPSSPWQQIPSPASARVHQISLLSTGKYTKECCLSKANTATWLHRNISIIERQQTPQTAIDVVQKQMPLCGFTGVAKSLRENKPPQITVKILLEMAAPGFMAGSAMTTMMTTQIHQDEMTSVTNMDTVTASMGQISLGTPSWQLTARCPPLRMSLTLTRQLSTPSEVFHGILTLKHAMCIPGV